MYSECSRRFVARRGFNLNYIFLGRERLDRFAIFPEEDTLEAISSAEKRWQVLQAAAAAAAAAAAGIPSGAAAGEL